MSTSRYQVLGKLGEGGMGVVYRARQVDLDREVAIKELLPDGDLDETAIRRFKREMDVLIGLSHPNIIRVFDAGERDGKLFYVMELLQAADLAAILKANGALPPPAVLSILDQMLDALEYCHGRGLIHRDIKPHNIMLEPSGRAILMDFGLVKKVEGTLLTSEGKLLGTPRYFPPEYLRGDDPTPAGDIWSLGVVAYELLCGERPFNALGMVELATAILKQPIVQLTKRRPSIPDEVASVVHRMLERPLDRRYATAAEVRAALAGVSQPSDRKELEALSSEMSLADLNPGVASRAGSGATRPSTGRTRARPTLKTAATRAPPTRPWWVPAAGALLFVAGIAVWMLVRSGSDTTNWSVATDAPADLRAAYDAADELVVTFKTSQPSRWTLEADEGAPITEASSALAHRIELPVDPGRAPAALALVCGPQRVRVTLPPSPASRVRALARALRDLGLDEKVTDGLWEEMRRSIPKWTTEKVEGSRRNCSPVIAQEAVAAKPQLAAKLDAWAEKVKADARVSPHLGEVLRTAGALLAADRVPEILREELLDVVGRLDLLDGLGEYVGRKPYFGVLDGLAPAIVIASAEGRLKPPLPPGLRELALPGGARRSGVRVYCRASERSDDSFEIGHTADDRSSVTEQAFADTGEAGPGGRRWHLGINGLSTQHIVHLARPGARSGIPVRLRGTYAGLGGWTLFTVTLTGPLARDARWTISQRRIFEASARYYFGLDRVAAESLPAK